MSELERLTEDRAADPELARLFRAGGAPEPLPEATYRRSRRRVLALGAAPAALGVVAWVQHAALGAALGTAVAVAAALPRLVNRQPAPAAHSAASVITTSVPRAPSAKVALPLPQPPRTASAVAQAALPNAPAPAASTTEPPMLRETRLLEGARAALEARPATSLRLLAEHEREFPNGVLAVEREFLTVAALVRLGQRARAEERAARLRARAPGMLYEQRLTRILGGGEASP